MEERLKLFLAMEGLTPSQFADKLGVQRSGVSHLLSGRNKPSFEFINKMLVAFPKINPDWLITGNGKAYRDFSTQTTDMGTASIQQSGDYPIKSVDALLEDDMVTGNEPDLFAAESPSKSALKEAAGTSLSPSPATPVPHDSPAPSQPEKSRQSSIPQQVAAPQPQKYPSENRVKFPLQAGNPAKRIAQIIIFYTDGTYEVR